MNLLDVTIVNVALPSIEADLGATPEALEWVAAAYVLTFAAGLLPCGRFGDIFGRRKLFLIGLTMFTVTSAVCGFAPTIGTLIAARLAQGIGAAMMVPQVMAIVHVIFPAAEKGRVFGIFGTVASLGSVAGPIIGGALISADIAGLSWRPIFLINLPLGLLALIGTLRSVPDLPRSDRMRVDWAGMALFTLAIILLVLPLIEGSALGWPWWISALMMVSIPAAYAFWRVERHREAAGLTELLPSRLMANGRFMLGLATVTLFFAGIPGLFFILAVFFQSGFDLTPLQSGLTTAPFPIGILLASRLTSRFGERYLSARLSIGALFVACGMGLLQWAIRGTGATLETTDFIAPLAIAGFGMGNAISAMFQSVLLNVPPRDAGSGAGAMQAFQQVGAALGIALIGQIFFGSLATAQGNDLGTAETFKHAAAMAALFPMGAFTIIALVHGVRALQKPPRHGTPPSAESPSVPAPLAE
jgi:EmrB/QacA subfamily drug resistance transporter